jgi:hypothetical protein
MTALEAAAKVYDTDVTSLSSLMNSVKKELGRDLTGEEIGSVADQYSVKVEQNYIREEGVSNCSFDMF